MKYHSTSVDIVINQLNKVREYEGTRVRRYESTKVREYEGTRVRRYESAKV